MNPQIITALAQTLCVPETAVHITLRPPLDFQSNSLYDVWAAGRHFIAKEYLNPDELEVAPDREFQALHWLADLDIAPRPVFYDPALAPVVVYEFMPGEMWNRQPPTPEQLTRLATLFTQLHALPTEGLWTSRAYEQSLQARRTAVQKSFQSYATWVVEKQPHLQPLADTCLDLLSKYDVMAEELVHYQPVLTFCRLDSRFANVIARPDGRLGLVDWEDSGLGDPALDLADLLIAANQEDLLDRAGREALLRPYLAIRTPQDPTLERRIQLYVGILTIFWLGLLLPAGVRKAQTGQLVDWRVNGMLANQRLRRYLARALAWPRSDFAEELAQLESVEFFPNIC